MKCLLFFHRWSEWEFLLSDQREPVDLYRRFCRRCGKEQFEWRP